MPALRNRISAARLVRGGVLSARGDGLRRGFRRGLPNLRGVVRDRDEGGVGGRLRAGRQPAVSSNLSIVCVLCVLCVLYSFLFPITRACCVLFVSHNKIVVLCFYSS